MVDYSAAVKKYVAECLAKEERKPVGMCGHWAYYVQKEKEYKKLLEEQNEKV